MRQLRTLRLQMLLRPPRKRSRQRRNSKLIRATLHPLPAKPNGLLLQRASRAALRRQASRQRAASRPPLPRRASHQRATRETVLPRRAPASRPREVKRTLLPRPPHQRAEGQPLSKPRANRQHRRQANRQRKAVGVRPPRQRSQRRQPVPPQVPRRSRRRGGRCSWGVSPAKRTRTGWRRS